MKLGRGSLLERGERRKARTTKVEKKLADAVACLLN